MKSVLSALIAVALMLVLAAPSAEAKGGCLDVEKATAKQMQGLKGVGPKMAKAIVDYRKKMRAAATKAKKGKWMFRNWKTLLKVPGVGPALCKANVAKVCFGGKIQKACPKK